MHLVIGRPEVPHFLDIDVLERFGRHSVPPIGVRISRTIRAWGELACSNRVLRQRHENRVDLYPGSRYRWQAGQSVSAQRRTSQNLTARNAALAIECRGQQPERHQGCSLAGDKSSLRRITRRNIEPPLALHFSAGTSHSRNHSGERNASEVGFVFTEKSQNACACACGSR